MTVLQSRSPSQSLLQALSRFAPRHEDRPSRADYAQLPRTWRSDLLAGVTVGIVALPLALAFGESSGVGPAAGLVTAIVAGLVAAVCGGSNVGVSGPTGAMVVVLAPIVARYGAAVVPLLSVLAGVLLFVLGAARVGRAVSYLPWPVIEGFTLGIAVIIFLQQVPAALSASVAPGQNAAVGAFRAIEAASWPTAMTSLVIVGLVAAVMITLPRAHRSLPASLIAIVLAAVGVNQLDIPVHRIGALPASLPYPALPTIQLSALPQLAGAVVSIALLAGIESLLAARVAAGLPGPDGMTTGPINPDRELVGQGAASIAAGLFGGMPATGAIARTAVNVRAGGRTRLAAITHSLVLLAVVYLAAGLVSQIPLAALAGVLMVTATRMISPATVRRVLRSTRSDAAAFVVTAVITVSFDLIVAIEIGMVGAAFLTLRKFARLGLVHRETLPGEPCPGDDRIALFRLDGLLFFGAGEEIARELAGGHGAEVVVLRLSHLRYLDASGAEALAEVIAHLERQHVTVLLKGIREDHLPLVTRMGVLARLRHGEHLFDDLDDAIRHARAHVSGGADDEALADASLAKL